MMSPSELVFGKRVNFEDLLQVKSNQNLGVGLFGEIRVLNKIDQSTWKGRIVLFIRSLYVTEMTEKVNEVAAKVLSNNMYRMGIFLRTHGWQTLDQAVKTDILSRVTTILENQLNEKDPKSLYERGLSIELGFKGTADIEKAVDEYYLPAAEQGYAPALIRLGELYQGGLVKVGGRELDKESALVEAFTCFRDAVEHGANTTKVVSDLLVCYLEGKGTEINIYEAEELYQKLNNVRDLTKPSSFSEAALKIGLAYRDGLHGVEVDAAKGFQYIKKAAADFNSTAVYELGVCYENGIGCEKDLSKAREEYVFGFRQDNVDAIYSYGVFLFEGIGGPENKEEAFKKFEVAAKKGHAEAQEYAGYCLLKGEGVTEAMNQGRYTIAGAIHYIDGERVTKMETLGLYWLTEAARQGVASASYQLGEYYLDKKDYVNAALSFREAWDRGSEEALEKLLYDLPDAICDDVKNSSVGRAALRFREALVEGDEALEKLLYDLPDAMFQDVIGAAMKGIIRLDSAKQSVGKFFDSIGNRMQQGMP